MGKNLYKKMSSQIQTKTLKPNKPLFFNSSSTKADAVYLSNGAFVEGGFVVDGLTFWSVEAAFNHGKWAFVEGSKAPNFSSKDLEPGKARYLGSKKFMDRRGATLDPEAWGKSKCAVMMKVLRARYQQDLHFQALLNFARDNDIPLFYYEESAVKEGQIPYWGCFKASVDGEEKIVGRNTLGSMMMKLAMEPIRAEARAQAEAQKAADLEDAERVFEAQARETGKPHKAAHTATHTAKHKGEHKPKKARLPPIPVVETKRHEGPYKPHDPSTIFA